MVGRRLFDKMYRPLTSHAALYGESILSYLARRENFGDSSDSYVVSETDYLGNGRSVAPGPAVLDAARVQFDQACGHVLAPGMARQHTEQVVSLTGAQADHPQRAGRAVVESPPDLLLNNPQSPPEHRIGPIVIVVPGTPVHKPNPAR